MNELISNKQPRHSLSKIDPEKMIAFCSVCGRTDIRRRAKGKYTVYICATKKRKYKHDYHVSHYVPRPRLPRQSGPKIFSHMPRPKKPNRLGHILSAIDEANLTAVCSACGRVPIYVSRRWKGKTYWQCGNRQRTYGYKFRKSNRQFINEYKAQHGCQRCGYKDSPRKLKFHRSDDIDEKRMLMAIWSA